MWTDQLTRCLVLLAAACAVTGPVRADELIHVRLDTSSLVGHASAPFAINMQLTNGNGPTGPSNTALVSNLQCGEGGSITQPAAFLGGVSGDPATTITLTDTGFLSEFVLPFTPGGAFSFDVRLTARGTAGSVPDQFAFSILDHYSHELPTMGKATAGSDVFLVVNIHAGTLAVDTYGSDASRAPTGGDPLTLSAPQIGRIPIISYGDVNDDGDVNITDAVLTLRIGAGLSSGGAFLAGDVAPSPSPDPKGFSDGRLDMLDVIRIVRQVLHLETHWP
ncbi:MAG TPA: hypothetical protein VGM37_14695 [Armatimonadota bacterium]|jgi:hypothetical protein